MSDSFIAVNWAAVSSKQQATEDKASIPDQLERERAVCEARGWRVLKELPVKGQSREYTSLDAAMRDIPELAELFDLARERKFNLLVCYDFNRFRSLQTAVVMTLAAYGVQVYSCCQPADPTPPSQFVYYNSDTSVILTTIGTLLSRTQLNSLRRGYAAGMPDRVDKHGLSFNNVLPYGYRKPEGKETDRKVVPVQIASECAHLLRMRAMYEAGSSGQDIADYLNKRGIRSKRGKAWNKNSVVRAMTNPFYAGFVVRGQATVRRDLLTGRRHVTMHPRGQWVLAKGRHKSLWTEADYRHLVELRDRRARGLAGKTKNTQHFSRLLFCQHCKTLMHVVRPDSKGNMQYRCGEGYLYEGHARTNDAHLIPALRAALADAVEQLALELSAPPPKPEPDHGATIHQALVENDEARARYQRMAGRGLISEDDLVKRNAELAAERADIEAQLADDQDGQVRRGRQRIVLAGAQAILAKYDALWKESPKAVNAQLSDVIEKVIIGGHKIEGLILRS